MTKFFRPFRLAGANVIKLKSYCHKGAMQRD